MIQLSALDSKQLASSPGREVEHRIRETDEANELTVASISHKIANAATKAFADWNGPEQTSGIEEAGIRRSGSDGVQVGGYRGDLNLSWFGQMLLQQSEVIVGRPVHIGDQGATLCGMKGPNLVLAQGMG